MSVTHGQCDARPTVSAFWGQKKLEWWGYLSEKNVWRYLQPSRYNTRTWRTNRRTWGDSKDRAYVRRRAIKITDSSRCNPIPVFHKVDHCYFYDNFGKIRPIFIIFFHCKIQTWTAEKIKWHHPCNLLLHYFFETRCIFLCVLSSNLWM